MPEEILGGGIALGTILLIEEDTNTTHYKTLLKYYLAEGVSCRQGLCVSTSQFDPFGSTWSTDLPALPKSFEEGGEGEQKEVSTTIEQHTQQLPQTLMANRFIATNNSYYHSYNNNQQQ